MHSLILAGFLPPQYLCSWPIFALLVDSWQFNSCKDFPNVLTWLSIFPFHHYWHLLMITWTHNSSVASPCHSKTVNMLCIFMGLHVRKHRRVVHFNYFEDITMQDPAIVKFWSCCFLCFSHSLLEQSQYVREWEWVLFAEVRPGSSLHHCSVLGLIYKIECVACCYILSLNEIPWKSKGN